MPLSFLLHTMAIVLFVVIPLMAVDALPTPRTMLAFTAPLDLPQPPPVAAPMRAHVAALPPSNPNAAPLDAPVGIAKEPDALLEPPPVEIGVVGSIDGFERVMAPDVAPPPPPPTPAKPLHVGGVITPPARIKDVAPVYPPIAQSARVEGVVIIQATIGPDGKVRETEVLRSIPLLDQAAVDAVRSWEYSPTRLNGEPVSVIMTVTVQFRLR